MLPDLLRAEIAQRPRLVVDDIHAWRIGPAARAYKRITLTTTGATILDTKPSTVVRTTLRPADAELGAAWMNWLLRAHGIKRIPWRSDQLGHLGSAQPIYTEPGIYDHDMAYLDIRKAYWSLYCCATMAMTYLPDPDRPVLSMRSDLTWEGAGDMAEVRVARNMVIGIARAQKRRIVTPDGGIELVDATRTNTLLSPGLWGYIADVLHSIACDALAHGAVYVNTDGYILPRDRADALADLIAERWCLATEIKAAGMTEVCAPGSWRCGDDASLTWPATPHRVDAVRRIDPKLQRFLAVRRQRMFVDRLTP